MAGKSGKSQKFEPKFEGKEKALEAGFGYLE